MSKKVSLISRLLLAAGLVGAMLLPNTAQKSATANDIQSQNVEAESELLQKYKDISALSMAKRKGLFSKASANDKSSLWRIHLAVYLAKHPELNKAQKDIVLEAMSLATPELFQISKDDFAWNKKVNKLLKSLKKRALEVFSKEEGAEIFAKLGGEEPISSSSEDIELEGTCVCSRRSDWCFNVCVGNACEYTDSGCGTLWGYPCDGHHCA